MISLQKIILENKNQDYSKIGDIVCKNLSNTLPLRGTGHRTNNKTDKTVGFFIAFQQPNPPHRSADARMNGQYLYEIWPNAMWLQVSGMYYNATGLSDYSSIPSAWK